MLISDWSSDVCSSDLVQPQPTQHQQANNSETNGMLEVARVAKRLAKITQFLPAQPAGLLLVGVFTDTQRGIDLDQAGTLCVREDCMQCRHRPRGNTIATAGHATSSFAARLCRLSSRNIMLHGLNVREPDRSQTRTSTSQHYSTK